MIRVFKDGKLVEKYSSSVRTVETFIEKNEQQKEVSLYNVTKEKRGLSE
jgi:hypothetical protein